LYSVQRHDTPSDTVDSPYMVNLANSSLGVVTGDGNTGGRGGRIPINKPPYGTLTAIDLNTGDTKWQIPLGDTPGVRNNPALRGVALPERLGVAGSPGSLVTKGGLVFSTGGGNVLYAIDSHTGKELWAYDLGQVAYANPMTYRTRDGRQMLVIATGAGANAKLVVFALKR
jgi:glucose dehydrogenase